MSQLGRRPFRMAMFGFAVASIFVSYQLLTDSESPMQRDSAYRLRLVPAVSTALLSPAFDPEVGTNRFCALSTVTALMKAGFYAAIRALLSRRLERPD